MAEFTVHRLPIPEDRRFHCPPGRSHFRRRRCAMKKKYGLAGFLPLVVLFICFSFNFVLATWRILNCRMNQLEQNERKDFRTQKSLKPDP
ncbi:hypothetical protein TSUD_05020 [Trifolium subterraneum]|uniref:Uncharacterized protein n=1 Tax=Trifolium subterraneum TaxID=3900 RepID=A0A2Z6NSV4_TRISU|nr:hypothetical protein TSUD_05020 [Trifolium subterraneum]